MNAAQLNQRKFTDKIATIQKLNGYRHQDQCFCNGHFASFSCIVYPISFALFVVVVVDGSTCFCTSFTSTLSYPFLPIFWSLFLLRFFFVLRFILPTATFIHSNRGYTMRYTYYMSNEQMCNGIHFSHRKLFSLQQKAALKHINIKSFLPEKVSPPTYLRPNSTRTTTTTTISRRNRTRH